jgi:hypothetical protein
MSLRVGDESLILDRRFQRGARSKMRLRGSRLKALCRPLPVLLNQRPVQCSHQPALSSRLLRLNLDTQAYKNTRKLTQNYKHTQAYKRRQAHANLQTKASSRKPTNTRKLTQTYKHTQAHANLQTHASSRKPTNTRKLTNEGKLTQTYKRLQSHILNHACIFLGSGSV